MKDFSTPKAKKPKLIEFKIDDDVFQAHPKVAAAVLDEVIDVSAFKNLMDINPEEASLADRLALVEANRDYSLRLANFLDTVLLPESAARWVERMHAAGDDAIDKTTMREVVRWLIEQYGENPTPPSSPSTNGRGGTTVSSTVTAPA